VHAVSGTDARWVAGKLREIYSARADVRIDGTATGHVVVNGPPETQQQIAHWLTVNGLAPASASPAPPAPPPPPKEPQPIVTQAFHLHVLDARAFEEKVTKTWGSAVQASHDSVGDIATFRFAATSAGPTSLVVDRRANTATVAAPANSAKSWQRVVSMLDSKPKSDDERTKIQPIVHADRSTIERAVTMLQELLADANKHRKQHIGQFVSMLFQQAGAQPSAPPRPAVPAVPGALPPGANPPGFGPPTGEQSSAVMPSQGATAADIEAIARINNVRIEILEDVVVISGRREDVERVARIIEQIEQQSVQFRPDVEIYHLKHVDSVALTDMINQVYATAFARQGLVTVVPLQRPNAVMLIGRKENIPAIVELIAKLDQPAPTEGEFKVIRLEYMSAIDAERTIRNFFIERPPTVTNFRPGLGTRALVIADYRTNSLLVQAAPRDLLEIIGLVERLDVPDSQITYEVRTFKLRNAIAETLAPILDEAITAAAAATQAQTVTAAAGQATPARATPPAVNLQFQRLGPDGVELIKSGIMANVRITADIRSNTLIVVGPPSAMDLMSALIEQLDRLPATEAQIKVFTLRNADATAVAETMSSLFGIAPAGTQQAVPGAGTPTFAGESAIVPLRFSVDQRTNSIIASGNAGDLNVIYHILVRLDEGDVRKRETKVYRLRNAPATDVANALTQLLQQQLTLIQIAPELVTPIEQIDQQVIVVPEPVTNSIIVSATERRFNDVNQIIENLDRRPPMIVVQVVLAEVTLQDNEAFGVEWGLQDALMFDRSSSATGNRFNFNSNPLTLPNDATATSLATATKVATQAVSNLALGRTDQALGFGGLALTASSESVGVLLRALEQSQRGQIISRPQVQTMDNQTAFVQVGAKVPRIIGATNTGLTVTPIINDINVGIIMQVTPRVSPDGVVVMQIYTEKSVVGPDATGIPIAVDANGNAIRSPQIPITTAQTIAMARSGQTIILGGLITKDLEEQSRRIPYLADIPVLGRLFRFDTVSNKRTELLIILTPYVVTSAEQIDWINAREGARMSWCLADIVNIHGPVPFGGNPLFNPSPTPLIFPDMQPTGLPGPVPPGGPGGPGAGPPGSGPPGTMLPGFGPPGMLPGTGLPGATLDGYPAGPAPYSAPTDSAPQPGAGLPGGYPSGPPPYGSPGELIAPPRPTPATPIPAAPIPAAPNVPPPAALPPATVPPGGVLIPQPPSLLVPPAGASGVLSPSQVEPAMPPVGTARVPVAMPPQFLPQMPPNQPPIVPAQFQQPAGS
jgi:type II secretion system protein D